MRILIIGLNFYPELVGIGRYTSELAQFLTVNGNDVHIVTSHPYYPAWKVAPEYTSWRYYREKWQEMDITRCPLWVPRHPKGLTRLLHLVSFALSSLPALAFQWPWKPNVVLCIAPNLLNAPFALVYAHLIGAKTWLHIQDFEIDAALRLEMLPIGDWLENRVSRLERALLNGFDRLSTISESMSAHLVRKGILQAKISLLPNWVDTDNIYPLEDGKNSFRTKLGITPDKLVLLYAGTMGKKQGLEVLLLAAKELQESPQIQFVLCGDGAVRAELESVARGMPNIHFLPVQPTEQLNELLNLADIHLLPQRHNAADLVMPSKLTGMLASGKAVIATAGPKTELGRVVRQVGIIVPPDDVHALVAAIRALVDNTDRRERLGRLGREYACHHLDKKILLEKFYTTFECWLASLDLVASGDGE